MVAQIVLLNGCKTPSAGSRTSTINATSAVSIGFSGDHTVHYLGRDKKPRAIDPDDKTPIVGPGRDTAAPAPAAVAYTRGSTPTTFAKLLVRVGNPANDAKILDPTGLEWRIKANKVQIASGSRELSIGSNEIDLGKHRFSAPLPSVACTEMLDVEVEIKYTGPEITSPTWACGGGGNVVCYCTHGMPNTPDGLRLVELYATMFPLPSSKVRANGSDSAALANAFNSDDETPTSVRLRSGTTNPNQKAKDIKTR
jgi:hypothetical protein